MRLLIILILFVSLSYPAQAQRYTTAAGIRVGNSLGLTVAQRVSKKVSIEAIAHRDLQKRTYLQAYARRHHALFIRNVNMYYGAGAHFGYQPENGGLGGFGLILGGEMSLLRMNFTLDYKPHFDLNQEQWFVNHIAVSARYIFLQYKWLDKWKRRRAKRQKKRRKYRGN
ncbi:MAG: hypothetical protein AAF206_21315 [Bacteroidota bacterium]